MTITRPRVDAGVPAGGEFTAFGHSDAVPSLGAPAPAKALDAETIFALAAEHTGPGVVPELERQYEAATTDTGRDLLLQKWDSYYNPASTYASRQSSYDLTPERCDRLGELGYTDLEQVSLPQLKNIGLVAITRHGITPDRLELINRLAMPEYRWSDWEKEAVLTADVDDLDALIQNTEIPTLEDKYLATVALLGPEKYNRAKEALAGGLRFHEKGLVESDLDPGDLARLRNALPDSKRGAWHIIGLAEKGITGEHLKSYGSKACETFSGPELDASGIKPAVIKSLVSSGVRGDLAFYRRLSDGGFTKGSDLKDAAGALETNDVAALVRARKHATGEQMAVFKAATRQKITLVDAQAIGRLAKAGITEPDQLRAWSSTIHKEANKYVDLDGDSKLAIHADVVDAGITPEHLALMSRAGIPVTEAPRHKNTKDLWAAGKPFRDNYEANEQRRLEQRWIREAQPWAFTKDTFEAGTAG